MWLLTRSCRMSSGTFSKLSHTALAAEWEKITGAWDTSRVRFTKASEAWDKSIIMPRRFISSTTFCRDSGVWEGAEGVREPRCVKHLQGTRGVGNGRSPHLAKACQAADVRIEVVSQLGGTLCPAR